MVLLDPRPKKNEADLFGRTKELTQLNRFIADKEPLIVISGLRRVGKTSLIMTALSTNTYSIFVDGFKLGEQSGVTKEQILGLFRIAIQQFFNKHKTRKEEFIEFLGSIAGISMGGYGIQFQPKNMNESSLIGLFDGLNNWAIEHEQTVVLAIDEVQEFSKAKKISLNKIFSAFFNYDNIVLILTGSQIGSLHDFVKKDDPDGPFYGRDRIPMHLDPLSKDESKEFLIKGLAQQGIRIKQTIPYDAILDEAVEELGGVIGWLVIFGRKCIRDNKLSRKAIFDTQEEGSKQMWNEFKKFLNTKEEVPKFLDIMTNLVKLPHSNFIKYIEKSDLGHYLDILEHEGFVKKDEKGRYFFSDRLLEYYFRKD